MDLPLSLHGPCTALPYLPTRVCLMKSITQASFFLLLAFVGITLLLRHHFLAGTLLMFFRWPLVSVLLAAGMAAFYNRRRLHAAAGLLGALALLGEWGHGYRQRARLTPPESQQEFRILSQNIYFKNRTPRRLIDALLAEAPEVLALQEVTLKWKKRLGPLTQHYPYHRVHATVCI